MTASMEATLTDERFPKNDMSRSWVLFSVSKHETASIQREIDKILSSYSFYPEIDWDRYGYRPPELYQVLGAWRNPNPRAKVFAFLLDNPKMVSIETTTQLLLHVVGEANEIKQLEPKVEKLKERYALQNKEKSDDLIVKERIDEMGSSKSLFIFDGILALITAIINGFSLYLRQIPAPELPSQFFVDLYKTFLALVHFAALSLFLLVVLLTFVFAAKFGILIIRKR